MIVAGIILALQSFTVGLFVGFCLRQRRVNELQHKLDCVCDHREALMSTLLNCDDAEYSVERRGGFIPVPSQN